MIRKCEHIGIMVSDLDRSIRFYTEVLGLELKERLRHNTVEIGFITVGDTELELIAGSSVHGQGDSIVNHVAFTVSDLDAAITRIREAGVETINDEPVTIWDGLRVFFFRGPDGEKLEFFERR